MKTTILSLAIALCAILNVQAKIITVSQNFTTPADYEDLQEAIDASVANDTIYVSVGSYGDISINKKLTLIGTGFDIDVSFLGAVTFVNTLNESSTSETTLQGFNIFELRFDVQVNTNTLGKTFKNLFFTKCKFRADNNYTSNEVFNGFYFRNCVFTETRQDGALLGLGSHSNHIFENCYIENINAVDTGQYSWRRYNNVIIRNCILDRNIADYAKGITIENSIILSSFGDDLEDLRDNSFNNNLFTGSGITGLDASNIVSADPLFEDRTGDFSIYNNYRLKDGSPAKAKGTNGTDIGMFGGNYPFEDYKSSIPRITSLRGENDVNQIKAGESLKIEIVAEANSNN